MKYKITSLSLLLLAAITLPILASAPAFARSNDDLTASPKPSVSPSHTPTTRKAEQEKEVKALSEAEVKNKVNSINSEAQKTIQQLEAKKTAAKAKTEAERTKLCQTKSTELSTRLNNKVSDVEKHKAVFDKIFARVTAFHDSKSLTTADYDSLVAKTTAAQQAAADSIATLKAFDTTVDCSNVGAAATKLEAFKQAVTQTRDSLKVYRTALKNLTVAVKASVPETSPKPSTSPTPATTQGANN